MCLGGEVQSSTTRDPHRTYHETHTHSTHTLHSHTLHSHTPLTHTTHTHTNTPLTHTIDSPSLRYAQSVGCHTGPRCVRGADALHVESVVAMRSHDGAWSLSLSTLRMVTRGRVSCGPAVVVAYTRHMRGHYTGNTDYSYPDQNVS